MNQISKCPICGHQQYTSFLTCKDHTVSKEVFNIVECNHCEFRYSNPIPLESQIGNYYQSEDYISHSNTSKDLISKIYQIARKNALERKFDIVTSRVKQKRLLDIGCGTGDFLSHCKLNGLTVNGIEPDSGARKLAIDRFGLEVNEENQLKNWANESFDIITLWHVLEHVYDLNDRVREIKRLLSEQGKIFIAVPNCNSADAKKYKSLWAAYDVPRHLYHFRKDQMKMLWENHGCEVEEILPMKLDAYYVSLLSEKYKGSGLLSYPLGFINGLKSNWAAKRTGEWSSLIYVIKKK